MSTVATPVTAMICHGCGWEVPPDDLHPFRCPHAGTDDVDHVLRRRIGTTPALLEAFHDREPDPFIRYRRLTHAWHTAMLNGMSDAEFIDVVRTLEKKIGQPFRVTPLYEQHALARAVDLHADLWVKNETGNVAGSHKGRHLMAIAIWLAVVDRGNRQRLAIASCGNAAIAAATIARGLGRPLDVYLPADADPAVIGRLRDSGAHIVLCERRAGEAGDPAYLRFREAVDAGALPFSVQGNENALAIEGGATLGWELVSQLRANRTSLDRLFIQVGGGALASSIVAAFEDAGVALPKIHAVQTTGVAPLARAFDRVAALECSVPNDSMNDAIHHRSQFMTPWETPAPSIATGILDDETYDWAAVVAGMRASGGGPVLVTEELLGEANRIAVAATGIRATATGTAGLAGLMALERRGEIGDNEAVGVVFTG
ncbi:MAG TPA: pyridoxal-phosphate dependent enzyme [Thermoanaerobaculia bacterium]|nr:pyridoxal-phosphate dependent enzyme [Thermoanaerobaculia bacterium]